MQLDEALRQISDIRQQMARSEVFRGYRSVTVGFSGVAGVLAAAFQPLWVASPESELGRYLGLWLGVAAVSLVVAGGEMWWRTRSTGSELTRQCTLLAVQQFLPCVVVGALLTVSIYRGAPHAAWMLPGLWSLVLACLPPIGSCQNKCSGSDRITFCVAAAVCSGGKVPTRFRPGRWVSRLAAANSWAPRFYTGLWSALMPRNRPSEPTKTEKTAAGAGRFFVRGPRARHAREGTVGHSGLARRQSRGGAVQRPETAVFANRRKSQPAPGCLGRRRARRNLEGHDRTATADHVSIDRRRPPAVR